VVGAANLCTQSHERLTECARWLVRRKRNKWLLRIQEWVASHGGGVVIPLSVEYEQKLWSLRDDDVRRESCQNHLSV
jgi:hypothetical protein